MQVFGVSLLVVLSGLPVLLTGRRTAGYDWDWFFAHYEALRRAIVMFHQFPWWNPWSAGGAPLYADPQVSLVSLQTPFVLAFGTVMGLKLGYVAHLLAGYWGMYLLLGQVGGGSTPARRALLSAAWLGSTFVRFHFATGHYTFLQYLLAPFVFYAYLRGLDDRRWRVIAGLTIAFFVNASPHHIAVQALFLLALLAGYRLYRAEDRRRFLVDHAWLGGFIVVLCLPRLLFAFEYLGHFPRTNLEQPVTASLTLAKGFLLPGQRFTDRVDRGGMPAWEVSAYMGAGMIVLVAVLLVLAILRWRRGERERGFLTFMALAAGTLVLGLGPFARFSPYALMAKLPVLSALQVPTRWFGWTLFLLVLAVASVRRWPRGGLVLLAAAALEVHAANLLEKTPFHLPVQRRVDRPFDLYDDYPRPPIRGTSMFTAMQQGYGEVRAYEPLLGYDQYRRPTRRCGVNRGCQMVSSNAHLTFFSPHLVRIERRLPGPINLNLNPSSYWLIDGQRDPRKPRVAEPNWPFTIPEPSKVTTLELRPARAWTLFLPLASLLFLALLRFTSGRRPERSAGA
jgi:hypothetical protein